MNWRTRSIMAPLILLAHAPVALAQTVPAAAAAQQAPPVVKAQGGEQAQAPSMPPPSVVASKGTTLTWLGHAAWMLRSPTGTTVLIDPWLNNPKQPKGFVLPERIDAIVVTHGHADHVGEAVSLAEKYAAPVVASFELIEMLGIKDGIGANPGGMVTIKDIEMHLTQAVHSSSVAMTHTLPPAPAAKAAPTAKEIAANTEGCSCPDHSKCPESHHHHDGDVSHQGVQQEHVAQDAGNPKKHKRGHHKHEHGKNKHQHEAEELVLGDDTNSSKGPKEAAVDEGLRLAQQQSAEAPKSAQQTVASDVEKCACGPDQSVATRAPGKSHLHYAGAAMGVIFKVAQGPTIFHAGDTDVFLDMGLIKRRYEPEVALLPIGGHYTMGPNDAALAASLLGAHDVVPMHYGTSPDLTGTPDELRRAMEDDMRVVAPTPGATISYAERR